MGDTNDQAGPSEAIDFFISYTATDVGWAEWIAWQLEANGYRVAFQLWDILPGHNFVAKMQSALRSADRVLLVLSPAALDSHFVTSEWSSALQQDPLGQGRGLIPVRISPTTREGLLAPIVYIDLVGKTEDEARSALLSGVSRMRAKPEDPPPFPKSPAAYPPTSTHTVGRKFSQLGPWLATGAAAAAVLGILAVWLAPAENAFAPCIASKLSQLSELAGSAHEIAAAFDVATSTPSPGANECQAILLASRATRAFSAIQSCATAAKRSLPSAFEVAVVADPHGPLSDATVRAGEHVTCTTAGGHPCCLLVPSELLRTRVSLTATHERFEMEAPEKAQLTVQTARASTVVIRMKARSGSPPEPETKVEREPELAKVRKQRVVNSGDTTKDPRPADPMQLCQEQQRTALARCTSPDRSTRRECEARVEDEHRRCVARTLGSR